MMRLRARSFAIAAIVTCATSCQRVPTAPAPMLTLWHEPIPTPPPPPPPPPPPQLLITRILAFGDSLTEGDSTPDAKGVTPTAGEVNCPAPLAPGIAKSYPAKLQALLAARYTAQTITVVNAGCGGERADLAGGRLRDVLATFHPQVMILIDGVNDLNFGTPLNLAADAVDGLIDIAQSPAFGAKTILGNLPRQHPDRGVPATLVDPFNFLLIGVAQQNGATLSDIHSLITLDMLAPDGLHLTQAGNDVLAAEFAARLKDRFEVAGDAPALPARRR